MQISRTLAVALVAISIGSEARAAGNSAAVTDTYRQLYGASLKCLMANWVARDERRAAGDVAKAAGYDRKAEEVFRTAYLGGSKIGKSQEEVTADIQSANSSERSRMAGDVAYLRQVASACRELDMMYVGR